MAGTSKTYKVHTDGVFVRSAPDEKHPAGVDLFLRRGDVVPPLAAGEIERLLADNVAAISEAKSSKVASDE